MIYIKLLAAFLKIGLFSFGGAYGAIPLIRDIVLENQWMDAEMFSNLVALSESTPGPIMVNMATYVGSKQGGFLGALAATIGVLLPSFLILLAVTVLFHNFLKREKVQAVLKGVKPCLMGVILATGIYMAVSICIPSGVSQYGHLAETQVMGSVFMAVDPMACILLFILGLVTVLYQAVRKKEFPPIALLSLAAVMGCIFYS